MDDFGNVLEYTSATFAFAIDGLTYDWIYWLPLWAD